MSDALPLPPHPNLEQYRKLAKDLQRACKSDSPTAIRHWADQWAERVADHHHQPADQLRAHAQHAERLHRTLRGSNDTLARATLAGAQFLLARLHGFASWSKFAHHVEALERANSPVSIFETAADAIVAGDLPTLRKLLHDRPGLTRERSTREHRSTLLHYVSANGIEDFRQRTPPNIVEVAALLLDSGAAVNAESEAYGGRSTPLNLTATSCHPESAGVQIPLLELLLERGAAIGHRDVVSCLHNGRGRAAAFLAGRGAPLDLEGAAGVGQLDVVRAHFAPDGKLKPPATLEQCRSGFAWACQFGHTAVVEFLLEHGVSAHDKLPPNGETGLHWAALGSHTALVKLLLSRGANVHALDDTFGGSPLGWALYRWTTSPPLSEPESAYETVALLAGAGATLDPEWFEVNDEDRRSAVRKLRADPRMLAALRGA
jgi:ankyrin repeat protein